MAVQQAVMQFERVTTADDFSAIDVVLSGRQKVLLISSSPALFEKFHGWNGRRRENHTDLLTFPSLIFGPLLFEVQFE
jgi:hypothetical protein